MWRKESGSMLKVEGLTKHLSTDLGEDGRAPSAKNKAMGGVWAHH